MRTKSRGMHRVQAVRLVASCLTWIALAEGASAQLVESIEDASEEKLSAETLEVASKVFALRPQDGNVADQPIVELASGVVRVEQELARARSIGVGANDEQIDESNAALQGLITQLAEYAEQNRLSETSTETEVAEARKLAVLLFNLEGIVGDDSPSRRRRRVEGLIRDMRGPAAVESEPMPRGWAHPGTLITEEQAASAIQILERYNNPAAN